MFLGTTGPPMDGLYDLESYLRRCRNVTDYYNGYLYWLMDMVNAPSNYSILLLELLDIPFVWSTETKELSMDSNRSKDGIMLREEFINEYIHSDRIVKLFKDLLEFDCSVLEMMVALTRRMERHVSERSMDNIFWDIMDNLELNEYDNDKFMDDPGCVYDLYDIIEVLLTRKYGKTGKGSMFPVSKRGCNLSDMEIWRQANLYCLCKE